MISFPAFEVCPDRLNKFKKVGFKLYAPKSITALLAAAAVA